MLDLMYYASNLKRVAGELSDPRLQDEAKALAAAFTRASIDAKRAHLKTWDFLRRAEASTRAGRMLETMLRNDVT